GGKLEIQSDVGRGTSVAVTLLRAEVPAWFAKELRIRSKSSLVILDDDESIHQIWRLRADSLRFADSGVKLVHLFSPDALRTWTADETQCVTTSLYLLDYELLGFK